MSGASISAEVAQALRDVAGDVGTGEFLVTLIERPTNPATPWDTGYYGEPTETELPAMVSDYPQSMIDGTLIQATDRRVMVAATGPKPTTADTLKILGTVYRIISVRETGPSGVPLYYFAQCRV